MRGLGSTDAFFEIDVILNVSWDSLPYHRVLEPVCCSRKGVFALCKGYRYFDLEYQLDTNYPGLPLSAARLPCIA